MQFPSLLRCLTSFTCLAWAGALTAADTPPTITAISNKTTTEDTQSASIGFTVADADVSAANLVVSGSSSNTALVDAAGFTFGGNGGSRTLRVTPRPDQSGITTITVTVSDGLSSTSTSFLLTVTAVADAPTLTTITALPGGPEDQAYIISYAALQAAANEADVDSAVINFRIQAINSGSLKIRDAGSSATPTSVSTGSTILTSSKELVWKPDTNATGLINAFTVKAHDGSLASATSIPVPILVAPINDAPTISTISAKSTSEDKATSAISFTVGDAETPVANLAVSGQSSNPTLVDVTGLAFSGTGASRSLIVTPKANMVGTTVITVTVADGGSPALTISTNFTLTVTAVADAPTLTAVSALPGAIEDQPFIISHQALLTAADENDVDSSTINFRIQAVTSGSLKIRAAGTTATPTAVKTGTTILDATKELVWTPVANANGTLAAFTVKAHDGSLLSSTSISVPVAIAAVNDAPTITSINDLSTEVNTTTSPISFTINDIETPVGNLEVTGSSDNPALIDSPQLTFGGTAGPRALIINPKYNQVGTATITVKVTDDGIPALAASTSFTITVLRRPPTADIRSTQTTYPLGYSFSGATSQAYAGRTITSYAWTFGDGTQASGVAPAHDFPTGQDYTVSLTVTDSDGLIGTANAVVKVPVSQTVYLTAVPFSVPPGVGGYDAGYTLDSQSVFQAGLGNIPSSIKVGRGWRTKLQGNGRYYGFKPDLAQPAQEIYASTLLIVATTTQVPNHLFLMSYGTAQSHTEKFPVGSGWIDDNGTATRRPVFKPNKAVAPKDICISQRAFTWVMPTGINPGINLTGYYVGTPIDKGILLGKGWIEGPWFNTEPLIGVDTFGSGTKTVQRFDYADGLDGVAPTAVYQGTYYMSPTYFIPNTYSKKALPTGQTSIGKGYLLAEGLSITFMPSGVQ